VRTTSASSSPPNATRNASCARKTSGSTASAVKVAASHQPGRGDHSAGERTGAVPAPGDLLPHPGHPGRGCSGCPARPGTRTRTAAATHPLRRTRADPGRPLRRLPVRPGTTARRWRSAAAARPPRSRRDDSAPLGAGVKAKPACGGSSFGRALTPARQRRMSAPGREPSRNRTTPRLLGLTRPRSFRVTCENASIRRSGKHIDRR
jgi:hypothetical protein